MDLDMWARWLALPHSEIWLDSKGEPYMTTSREHTLAMPNRNNA